MKRKQAVGVQSVDAKTSIISNLRRRGLRITQQKRAIIDALIENNDRMLSVCDVAALVADSMDYATVYRNLKKFHELNIVESMADSQGVLRYTISDGMHHHHFICTACGRIIKFPCIHPFWREIAAQQKFKEEHHRIDVFGVCESCQK